MIPAAARQALVQCLGDGVRFDVPMARHTSLRVGGPADVFAQPRSRGELAALLGICHHRTELVYLERFPRAADSPLAEEHRAWRSRAHRQGDHGKDRSQQNHPHECRDEIN